MKKKLSIAILIILTFCSCQKEEYVSVEMLKNKALSGDKKAVKRLVDLFDSNDIAVQSDTYKAMLDVKDAAVDTLLEELETAKGDKWEYTVAALGMIKNKKAIDKLAAALKEKRNRRYIAAFSLGQIDDLRVILPLVQALDDSDPEVKKYAAISLNKYGSDATDELIKFMNRADVSDKTYALSVIGEIKDARTFDVVLKELDGQYKEKAIWVLGKLKDERAVDYIVKELTNPDWKIRFTAARSLGTIHSTKAVAALEQNLKDENVFVREWTARALEDITGKDYKYKNEKGEEAIPTSLYR